MVSEDLEGHQGAVLTETLSEKRQAKVLNIIVSHIEMDQRAVDGKGLGDGFRSVVCTFVVCQVKRFECAILAFEVLRDCLAASERNFIRVQVEDAKRVILKQVLHHDVNSIVPQFVLLQTQLLQANIVLEHLTEVNSHTLADRPVHWIIDIELLKREIARVEYGQYTDDTVMVNLIVAQAERDKLVMSE